MKLKKIDIYVDGHYCCSSVNYNTCKEAISDFQQRKSITIASVPMQRVVKITQLTKVTANIDHNWRA